MEITQTNALKEATGLVTAGLQGGGIKLRGIVSSDTIDRDAKADALYLTTLISELAAAIRTRG